jgi:hypothetical protein
MTDDPRPCAVFGVILPLFDTSDGLIPLRQNLPDANEIEGSGGEDEKPLDQFASEPRPMSTAFDGHKPARRD